MQGQCQKLTSTFDIEEVKRKCKPKRKNQHQRLYEVGVIRQNPRGAITQVSATTYSCSCTREQFIFDILERGTVNLIESHLPLLKGLISVRDEFDERKVQASGLREVFDT
jgi:hypothetical protein